jgi:hypothetical protein
VFPEYKNNDKKKINVTSYDFDHIFRYLSKEFRRKWYLLELFPNHGGNGKTLKDRVVIL